MQLSNEQELLIEKRAATDSPSPILAYILWAIFGIFGAHRIYLNQTRKAVALLALTLASLVIMGGGIAFGGTPVDHLFYEPTVNDFLRYSQSLWGVFLFYTGVFLFILAFIWWLSDAISIMKSIQASRALKKHQLTSFYQNYHNL